MGFAKLFESEECGQILVLLHGNDETNAPEIRFFALPKDLGVCSLSFCYEDSDEGWSKAEKMFEEIDSAVAERTARIIQAQSATVVRKVTDGLD